LSRCSKDEIKFYSRLSTTFFQMYKYSVVYVWHVSNCSTIFGVSSSEKGWGQSIKDTGTFLISSMKPFKETEWFAVMYDSKKAFKELFSPKPFTYLLGGWFLLYIAYHVDCWMLTWARFTLLLRIKIRIPIQNSGQTVIL